MYKLRRAFWSNDLESVLLDDPSSLNLLYFQAVSNIKHGIMPAEGHVADELAAHRYEEHHVLHLTLVKELRETKRCFCLSLAPCATMAWNTSATVSSPTLK